MADALFEGCVAPIQIGVQFGGPAHVRSQSEDAEAAGTPRNIGVDPVGHLTYFADDAKDVLRHHVEDGQPVVDLAACDAHALVAASGYGPHAVPAAW